MDKEVSYLVVGIVVGIAIGYAIFVYTTPKQQNNSCNPQ